MAGMPSSAASLTAAGSRSTDSRSTPGIEGTGVRLFVPSWTNTGQIKSSTLSRFSATNRRDHAVRRFRRMRVEGNRPGSEGRRGTVMGHTPTDAIVNDKSTKSE